MPVKNVCDCYDPPGGSVVCEPHQMAICVVANGVARRECLSPLATEDIAALVNWTLAAVTGIRRSETEPVHPQYFEVLAGGRYRRPDGAVVTFTLPESVAVG